jgi:hypothetical protein
MAVLASCGAVPRGNVTVALRSGEQREAKLLTVDSDAVTVRYVDEGVLDRIPFDNVASIERPGAVSSVAVIFGGLAGTFAGGSLGAVGMKALTPNEGASDVRTGPPVVAVMLVPVGAIAGAAAGIWSASHIHKPGTTVAANRKELPRLRTLALFPNGLSNETK